MRTNIKWVPSEQKLLVETVISLRFDNPLLTVLAALQEAIRTKLAKERQRSIVSLSNVPWLMPMLKNPHINKMLTQKQPPVFSYQKENSDENPASIFLHSLKDIVRSIVVEELNKRGMNFNADALQDDVLSTAEFRIAPQATSSIMAIGSLYPNKGNVVATQSVPIEKKVAIAVKKNVLVFDFYDTCPLKLLEQLSTFNKFNIEHLRANVLMNVFKTFLKKADILILIERPSNRKDEMPKEFKNAISEGAKRIFAAKDVESVQVQLQEWYRATATPLI